MTAKKGFTWLLEFIVVAPAILVGVVAMISYGVPSFIFLQNLVALVFCLILSNIYLMKRYRNTRLRLIWVSVSIMFVYFLTFDDGGVDGVHRWIGLGPVRLYVSSVLNPLLLIGLWGLLDEEKEMLALGIAGVASFILLVQPDAAQLTAFALPMIIMVLIKMRHKVLSFGAVAVLLTMCVISWIFIDGLPPVEYVEEIFGIVMRLGTMWTIIGFMSLLVLPMPFLFLPKDEYRLMSRCIGLYFAIFLVTPVFGNFPVPMMGYGISPIIGYFIALTWLLDGKIKTERGSYV